MKEVFTPADECAVCVLVGGYCGGACNGAFNWYRPAATTAPAAPAAQKEA